MRLLLAATFALLFSFAANAADYSAVTGSDAVLRAAPSETATKLGVVAAGTRLEIEVCFDQGAFCAVTGESINGYVSGSLLVVAGTDQTVAVAEAEKWAQINTAPSLRDVRTEGDSYMEGACGISITPALKDALGRTVVNTAKGGSEMGSVRSRVLAPENKKLLPYVTVFWDGSQNGITTVTEYADVLGDAIAALGHDHYVVIPASAPAATTDLTEVSAIQKEFKRRWPDHYLDWRDVLPTANGKTSIDQQCDDVHLNAKTLASIADAIGAFIRTKGW